MFKCKSVYINFLEHNLKYIRSRHMQFLPSIKPLDMFIICLLSKFTCLISLWPTSKKIQKIFKWSLCCSILSNDQRDALFNVFIYFISLHVSSIKMLIIRRSIVLIHHLVCINKIDLLTMSILLLETCREMKYIKKCVKFAISKNRTEMHGQQNMKLYVVILTFRRRNFLLNFSTPCISNVNNIGTKKGSIMK
jgi:hypothetical protein